MKSRNYGVEALSTPPPPQKWKCNIMQDSKYLQICNITM